MASNYEIIETACVTQMASLTPDVDVLVLPENESNYKRGNVKTRVTVSIISLGYGEKGTEERDRNYAVDISAHQENVYIEVVIQSVKLRGERGVYQVFEQVKAALLGFNPHDCDKMYLLDFEIFKREDSVFHAVAKFRCSRLVVEYYEEPTEPLLTEITYDNNIQ